MATLRYAGGRARRVAAQWIEIHFDFGDGELVTHVNADGSGYTQRRVLGRLLAQTSWEPLTPGEIEIARLPRMEH